MLTDTVLESSELHVRLALDWEVLGIQLPLSLFIHVLTPPRSALFVAQSSEIQYMLIKRKFGLSISPSRQIKGSILEKLLSQHQVRAMELKMAASLAREKSERGNFFFL